MQNSSAKSKAWYQKWWGIVLIVLIILFFPIVLVVILPYLAWTKTKWHKGTKIAISVIFGFLLLAILGSSAAQKTGKVNDRQVIKEVSTEPKQAIEAIFDVESYHGKNIDEIIKILGTPVNNSEPTSEQKNMGIKEWDKTFKKDNYNLLVTYRINDGSVIDLFASFEKTTREDGLTTKEEIEKLKKYFNVKENGSYHIEPVKALKNTNFFTGIKMIPIEKVESEVDFSDIKGLQTKINSIGMGNLGQWKDDGMGGYMSITGYYQFGNETPQNNLAFYLTGNEKDIVDSIELVLNINKKGTEKEALDFYEETIKKTFIKLGITLPINLVDSIRKQQNFKSEDSNLTVILNSNKTNIDTWSLKLLRKK